MNESTPPKEERMAALSGLGTSRKRVEDARFTQGKGNYVDDMKMPGMLFGDFVRSPYAHARIKSINTEAALALPGVHAVLTAADLEPLGLHWMPTLAGDKQMVLADGKVLFQGQEVAYVVADDRYVADDGIQAVVVEYEELPVVVDPFKAELDDAPVLREDIADQSEGAHGPRRHPNHIFTWESGDRARSPDSHVKIWLGWRRGPCAPSLWSAISSRNTGASSSSALNGSTTTGNSSYSTTTA